MAHYFILTCILLLTAQVRQKPDIKLPAPPETIRLEKNVYMDRAEISNEDWLAYLYYLRKDSSAAAFQRALPDTTVWNEVDKKGILSRVYLQYFKYRVHPVVGVSYEQAVAYHAWRSATTTHAYNSKNRKGLDRRGLTAYKVVFKWRLPTESEWEKAAAGGLDPVANPYGVRTSRYRRTHLDNTIIYDSLRYPRPDLAYALRQHLRRNPMPAYNCINTFGYGFRFGLYITNRTPGSVNRRQVIITRPNEKGYFDMIGNVAEMVSEKGKAKGGSWMHYIEFSQIRMTQTYNAPAAWLGFRSVCEVSLEPLAAPPNQKAAQ